MFLCTTSVCLLNTSMGSDSHNSLGGLFYCLTTLSVKTFFPISSLNLPYLPVDSAEILPLFSKHITLQHSHPFPQTSPEIWDWEGQMRNQENARNLTKVLSTVPNYCICNFCPQANTSKNVMETRLGSPQQQTRKLGSFLS